MTFIHYISLTLIFRLLHQILKLKRKIRNGAEEVAQWLSIHTALADGLKGVPSTHARQLTTAYISSSRRSDVFFRSSWAPSPYVTLSSPMHTYAQTKLIFKRIIKLS